MLNESDLHDGTLRLRKGKRTYHVVGQKDIRLSAPIHSFTYLPAEILDDQQRRIGVCEARFDHKRDLWSFLRSFRRL